MKILGISCYFHDASAALLVDGKVVAAAQEERFTRKKHDCGFPINAIRFCLDNNNTSGSDLDIVAFYEKPLIKFERVLFQHLDGFPKSLKTFLSSMPSWMGEKLRVVNTIKKKVKFKGEIVFIPHHLAHASSFLISPYKQAAIVTLDGVGEWTATAYGIGKSTSIKLLKEIVFPSSLGLLYSAITAYLGFSVNNSEYKVMGLSAYGDNNRDSNSYYQKLKKVIYIKADGSFCFDMSYFKFHYADKMPSDRLCALLDSKPRSPDEPIAKRHKDIAAAVQMLYKDILFKILNHVQKETKMENLVISGGCALNSLANGKILSKTRFKSFWSQPDPGDGGTSIGAAIFAHHRLTKSRKSFVLDNPFLGPGFSEKEIKAFLDKRGICYRELKSEKGLISETAKLLLKNNVVGWFQGRMEWGPRALGARSIFSNPCNPDMKEILNQKVKHREAFRPFAPVVCKDDAKKFFECDKTIPGPADFMLLVYPILNKWHKKIPSVVHVDGSGRLQTIEREQNPLYYDLIKEFGRLSGMPILINTSFNIRGEPIVCTPHDAYKCMMGTCIDYLVMDRFLIKREDNQKDIWDSEALAKD